jgi:hypothetical protein
VRTTCPVCKRSFLPRAVTEGQKYCSWICYRKAHQPQPAVARFWRHVRKAGPRECWIWTGALAGGGYGQFGLRAGQNILAHRYSFLLAHGHLPHHVLITHDCDVKACVNPSHLHAGTYVTNAQEASQRGQLIKGDWHWTRRQPEKVHHGDQHWSHVRPDRVTRGERHGQAKLTARQVRRIRTLAAQKQATHHELAEKFGVSDRNIHKIVRYKSWAHVS